MPSRGRGNECDEGIGWDEATLSGPASSALAWGPRIHHQHCSIMSRDASIADSETCVRHPVENFCLVPSTGFQDRDRSPCEDRNDYPDEAAQGHCTRGAHFIGAARVDMNCECHENRDRGDGNDG